MVLRIRNTQALIAAGVVLALDEAAAAEAAVADAALVVHSEARALEGGQHRLVAPRGDGEHFVAVVDGQRVVLRRAAS